MDLILWRHADAGKPSDEGDDLQRGLTKKGHRQATRMAQWLDQNLPAQLRVVCSPAVRTHQTALHLQRQFKLRDELLPGATAEDALAVAYPGKYKGACLLIGHQPTLGNLVSQLLGMNASTLAIKKGSVWWLKLQPTEGAQPSATLVAVQSPDLV